MAPLYPPLHANSLIKCRALRIYSVSTLQSLQLIRPSSTPNWKYFSAPALGSQQFVWTNTGKCCYSSTPSRPRKTAGIWKVTWRAVGISAISFSLIVGYVLFEKKRLNRGAVATVESTTIGKPNIGGPWTLINQKGEVTSSSDFRGKYQLVYFGFTFCPDICPEELIKQTEVIKLLDDKLGPIVQPIFITVDPGRDTPEKVGKFCAEFHPRLIGLTGTKEEIKAVTRSFRVYYNETTRTSESDYLVDHSIIQYLMDKEGKFVDFFGKNLTVNEMYNTISKHINSEQKAEKETKGVATDLD